MQLKSIMLSIALLLSSSALALGVPETYNHFDGVYLGVGGGLTQPRAEFNVHSRAEFNTASTIFSFPSLTSANLVNPNETITKYRGIGTVFTGYGFNYHRLFIAAEIRGSFSDGDLTQTLNGYQGEVIRIRNFSDDHNLYTRTSLRINTAEFDADLRPGFELTPTTLIYGRIGIAVARLKLSNSTQFSQIANLRSNIPSNQTLTLNSGLRASNRSTETGLRLGVGVEQIIGANFSFSLDYIYTDYGKLSVHAVGNNTTFGINFNAQPPRIFPIQIIDGLRTHSIADDISRQTVMFSLLYHFGWSFA